MTMPEENAKTYIFTREEATIIQRDISNIRVSIGELNARVHVTPCKALEDHTEECGRRVKDLHKRIEGKDKESTARWERHIDDHHSPKSIRENWVAIAVIGCTVATIASPFITWWLMSHQ